MAKLNRRPRWRGPALGGRLQRGVRFCFSAHDGEATTPTLTEWACPKIVHAGRWPTATQMVNQARALSIGTREEKPRPPAGYTSAGRRTARQVSIRCRVTRY